MRFFGYDGPLAEMARRLGRLMFLNLCVIVCSLPVFTIGAAVTALYAVFLNGSEDSGAAKLYFRAFSQNFKKATLIWLPMLGAGIVLCVSAYLLFAYQVPGAGLLRVLLIVLFVVYCSYGSYVFPLQAHYENTVRQTMKNACILGVGMFLPGIVMTAITLLPLILLLFDLRLFAIALYIWVVLGAALAAWINSLLLRRIFRKLQPEEGGSFHGTDSDL